VEARYLNELRDVFSLIGRTFKTNKKKMAQFSFLLPFLKEYNYRQFIKFKFSKTIRLVMFIQTRFKNTVVILQAKLDSLHSLWNKEKSKIIFEQLTKKGNSEAKTFAKKLANTN